MRRELGARTERHVLRVQPAGGRRSAGRVHSMFCAVQTGCARRLHALSQRVRRRRLHGVPQQLRAAQGRRGRHRAGRGRSTNLYARAGLQGRPTGGRGRVGPMCEAVGERCAAHGDVGATGEHTNNNLLTPLTFTTTGTVCDYHHDCPSYACFGFCAYGKGGPVEGALCGEDADCLGGKCESRSCGAEYRVGEDTCACSRSGYLAPRCEKCPGFNGVWSASVCGGRGTCAARYLDDGRGSSACTVTSSVCARNRPGCSKTIPSGPGPNVSVKSTPTESSWGARRAFSSKTVAPAPARRPMKTAARRGEGLGRATGGACAAGERGGETGMSMRQRRQTRRERVVRRRDVQPVPGRVLRGQLPAVPAAQPSTDCDGVPDIFTILGGTQCFKNCNVNQVCLDTKQGSGLCQTAP